MKGLNTITIDGETYDLDDLPPSAKAQIESVMYADQEIARLQKQLALAQTGRAAYVSALKSELAKAQKLVGH